MVSSDSWNRITVLLVGLLVLFAPALFVIITLEFLILTGEVALTEISLLEFLELYIIDLILLVGFGYGVYRLTLWVTDRPLRESVNELRADDGPVDEPSEDAQPDDRQ
ncbi:hypothetical protein BRD03_03315 [Halobacteriales archaeon QS_9_68_17]|nr:MAG: hypothetical protein BRD03_03315 [Halobacteriales archaeon QS_9_68_17]